MNGEYLFYAGPCGMRERRAAREVIESLAAQLPTGLFTSNPVHRHRLFIEERNDWSELSRLSVALGEDGGFDVVIWSLDALLPESTEVRAIPSQVRVFVERVLTDFVGVAEILHPRFGISTHSDHWDTRTHSWLLKNAIEVHRSIYDWAIARGIMQRPDRAAVRNEYLQNIQLNDIKNWLGKAEQRNLFRVGVSDSRKLRALADELNRLGYGPPGTRWHRQLVEFSLLRKPYFTTEEVRDLVGITYDP